MNWLSHNNKETRKTTITKDRITELQWLVRERQKIKHIFYLHLVLLRKSNTRI